VLPKESHWTFNANRSQGELWTINLTVSATGFHPITVLVCGGEVFDQWLGNGSLAGCLLVTTANRSLHCQVAFSHSSYWYVIRRNPWQVSLLFSLIITCYCWTSGGDSTTNTTGVLDRLGDAVVWFMEILVVVLVLVPCVRGRSRRRRRAD
jgi:hypothetical protein